MNASVSHLIVDLNYAKSYVHTENGHIDEIILKPVPKTTAGDLLSNTPSTFVSLMTRRKIEIYTYVSLFVF